VVGAALDRVGAIDVLGNNPGVAAAHPEMAEIEVNPVLALPDGALGLDARVVRAERAA
jgi:acetate---CoA ligase (ADP-forming)